MKLSKLNFKPLMFAMAAAIGLASMAPVSASAASTDWWVTAQKTVIGSKWVNVKNFGAKGDGVHNDTAAIQAAIDSLPTDGGTIQVPNGRYMIDALKSIKMRSHTRLLMDQNAELHALPNSSTRYYIVDVRHVNNVRIVGGRIVGDRATHIGADGEWGMGIGVYDGQNIVIKDIHISDCWGDGVMIASVGKGPTLQRTDNVTLLNVVSDNNRRQGLSITVASHVYVINSTFSNTNGTAPMAGIDIEPQTQGTTDNVRLANVHLLGNSGNGLELHENISGIVMFSSELENNHGFGVLSVKAPHLRIGDNTITKNGLAGVRLAGADDVYLHHNTITYNSTRYMSPTLNGGNLTRDYQNSNSTNVVLLDNTFTPRK